MDSSLVRALAWTGGIKWSVQIVSWASMLVLARLLTPADYGVVGMTSVFILLTGYIAEFGIGTAIINARNVSKTQLSQMNSIALMLGTFAMLVCWASAKPLSRFFHTPVVASILVISSVAILTESIRSVAHAHLSKELEFRFLAIAEAVRAFVFNGVALALAFLGYRYWSLVVANTIASALMGVVVLQRRRFPCARPSWNCIRDLMTVARNIMVGNLAWYGYSNADFFVAGRLLGPASLGAYTNAWAIATAPLEKIASIVNRVTPSFFSALGEDNSGLRRYVLRITEMLALFLFPAICGIALVAPEFVHLAFGPKWEGMIAPLRLLAIYAGVSSLASFFSPVLNAKGHSRFTRNLSGAAFLVLTPAFYWGGKMRGAVGIAAVWIALYPVLLLFVYVKTFRSIHLRPYEYLKSLAPALSGTALMAAVVCLAKMVLPGPIPLPLRFTIIVSAGMITYASAVTLLHRDTVRRVVQLIRMRHLTNPVELS